MQIIDSYQDETLNIEINNTIYDKSTDKKDRSKLFDKEKSASRRHSPDFDKNANSRNLKPMLKNTQSKKSEINSEYMSLRDLEARNIKTFAIPEQASPIFKDQLLLNPISSQIPYAGKVLEKQTLKQFGLENLKNSDLSMHKYDLIQQNIKMAAHYKQYNLVKQKFK